MSELYGWLPGEIDDLDLEMFLDYLIIPLLAQEGENSRPAETKAFSRAHAAQYGFKVVKKS